MGFSHFHTDVFLAMATGFLASSCNKPTPPTPFPTHPDVFFGKLLYAWRMLFSTKKARENEIESESKIVSKMFQNVGVVNDMLYLSHPMVVVWKVEQELPSKDKVCSV